MKLKALAAILSAFLMVFCLGVSAYADIGPKPSVVVTFKGLSSGVYYVTLLSKEKSTGPYSEAKKNVEESSFITEENRQEDLKALNAFRSYSDSDGFYFINYFARSNTENTFRWGYYPPGTFKVLVYFSEDESFLTGEISERYAFDSYFTATQGEEARTLTIQRSYDYTAEIASLIARIVATVAVEILVALLFGLRSKRLLLFVTAVNIATQIVLNVLLNVSNYSGGSLAFVFNYVWMELVVIIIEAVLYSGYFKKLSAASPVRRWVPPVYAVASNVTSFMVGMYVATLVPGIF